MCADLRQNQKYENGGRFLCSRNMYLGIPTLRHKAFDNLHGNDSVNLFFDVISQEHTPIVFTPVVKNKNVYRRATYDDKEYILVAFQQLNIRKMPDCKSQLYNAQSRDLSNYYQAALPGVLCFRLGVHYLGKDGDVSTINFKE